MDNVHFNGLFYNTMPTASSSTLPQCVKSDPNLFNDDVDIKFSKRFNTCKVRKRETQTPVHAEVFTLKHESKIFRRSSNPVCGFSMVELVRFCAVLPAENWLGSPWNHIQVWMTV